MNIKLNKQQIMIINLALEYYTRPENQVDCTLRDYPSNDHQEALRLNTIFEFLDENINED